MKDSKEPVLTTAPSKLPFARRMWFRVTAAVVAAVIVVVAGFSADAVLVEHRSVQSKAVEFYLRLLNGKASFTDAEKVKQLIDQRRTANEKPYTAPAGFTPTTSMTETTLHGMQTFVFGGKASSTRKEVLYLHGGAYINRTTSYHFTMLDEIARLTGSRIVMPLYPLAPVHTYKEAYRDVLATYKDMVAETDPGKVTLMGDSAGGGFALGLAQVLAAKDLPQPMNIVLLSPWLDLTMTNPGIPDLESSDPMLGSLGLVEMGRDWAGSTSTSDPQLSPINGSLKGLAHITLFGGTHELFVADARKFRDIARDAGRPITYIEKAAMNHVYPVYPTPEGERARQQIAALLNGND